MNTSRAFEIQKKKLAVRRLSQGSRGKVASLQGNQNQGKWGKGDLRSRIKTRTVGKYVPGKQNPIVFGGQQEIASSNLVLPIKKGASNVMEAADLNIQLNPFAASLESSREAIFFNPDEVSKNVFAGVLNDQKQPSAEKDSDLGLDPFMQKGMALHTDRLTELQSKTEGSNPFLLALKGKTMSSSIMLSITDEVGPPTTDQAKADLAISRNPFDSVMKHFPTTGDAMSLQAAIAQPTLDTDLAPVFAGEGSLTAELTSLRLKGVPQELNNKHFLRDYYSQFGSVKRIYSHPASDSAVVTFFEHDSAANAKKNGTVLTGGTEVSVFWNQPTSRAQSLQKAPDKDKDMHEAASFTLHASGDKEAAVKSEKEALESQRNRFAAMIENFVETFRSVPAKDSMEKGGILEQIDQKIREGMGIETDLNKALHFIGTCPDMCPEKERYFREHRQRLATFEMRSGRAEAPETRGGQYFFVDPSKAVKEYSRSSADQEKPLPHELRPEHVLQLTMNYLMLNVMNADDKNWADRYDFVWNRTRGIRKDITQQHLCNESSVDLIEKCTRFHIVCSHHLCEEDINVFDPKINNEHLTKCLQSLKHMYEDLYFKKSITCPNEAEFRCYQILLNLNNGDILREITEFRQEIRESMQVKFALEVLRALNSTNYVRFFKLLHSGSYLMACIMQRYFNQIRSTGLFIMNKAYTSAGMKPVPIPLSDIARLFAIDELDEAAEFCSHYGFQIDNGMVYFSKSSFEEPESKFLPVRNGVIDKKRTSSFGEVVNGKPLPEEFDYTPTISFDADGYYNGNYHTLALKGILRDTHTNINKIFAVAGEKLLSYPMRVGKDDIKAMCSAIIIPVVQKEVSSICTEAVEDARSELVAMNEVADCVITSVVRTEAQACIETEIREGTFENLSLDLYDGISGCVIEEQVRKIIFEELEAERRRRDQDRRIQQFHLAAQISRDFLRESIQSNTKDILHEVIREERHEMEMILLHQQCTIVSREYLERFLVKEIREICTASKDLEVKWRKEKLERIKMKIIISRKRKIFEKWLKERETRSHIRDTLHHFPACSPLQSFAVIRSLTHHSDHASQLPSYISLKNNVELTVSSVSNTAKRRDDHRNAIELYHQRIVSVRYQGPESRKVTAPRQ